MDVHAVLGEEGTGTTATAVNLAVALQRAGHHAAVLDLTGDVTALLGLADGASGGDGVPGGTEPLADGGSAAAATVDASLDADVDEATLRDYREASGDGASAPAAGADDGPDGRGRSEPDANGRPVDHLPVIVAGERSVLATASPDRRESLRGDLAFAYDHVIVDAGAGDAGAVDADEVDADEVDDGVTAFADGLVVVTTPDADAVAAAARTVAACTRAGGSVVGAVVNRAGAGTDPSAIRERMRTEVLGTIPEDARTPGLEPVVNTVPGSPAAAAYGRLAEAVVDRAGASGLVDGGPSLDAADPEVPAGKTAEGAVDVGGTTGTDPDDGGAASDDGGHPLGGSGNGDDEESDGGGLLSRFF